ncbi:rtf2 [Candida margitis]|uniref:rtf2 n=1 Tax=Candida margitis TaxID=1775924 RepID=UPI002227CD67|nr:rtf2 [Candida margitis]KAI5969126.1 rtf2 [Candida margitis]
MGNDGGTIAKRQDILSLHNSKSTFTEFAEDKGENKEQILLQSCAFSGLPLYKNNPVVGDFKGKLYIKEKILQYLLECKLNKLNIQLQFQHLKSLKDLRTVKITWDIINDIAHFQCPITKELDDKTSYSYLRPCGCVMSYKLLKELKRSLKTVEASDQIEAHCPVCNKEFTFDYDLVIINPINKSEFDEFNEDNYKYLRNVLRLSHAKEPLKRKKKKSEGEDGDDEEARDDLIRKRKMDTDDGLEVGKRIRT